MHKNESTHFDYTAHLTPGCLPVNDVIDMPQLSEIIETISSELELSELLTRVLRLGCELVGADDGAISLYQGATRSVKTAAIHNLPAIELGAELAAGMGLAGRVLATGRSIHCRYGDLPGINLPQCREHRVIGVPIIWRNVLIGVFGMGVRPPKQFGAQAMAQMELLARHTAIAIHNAQAFQLAQRRATRWALINKIALIVQGGSTIQAVLQDAADAIHDLLAFQNVDIPLIDPEQPDTLIVAVRGGAYKLAISREDRLRVDRGIMGAAVSTRRTQLVNDVSADPRYVNPPGVQAPLAELAVPIIYGNEVLGVLNVEGGVPFDHLDQESLELIADQLAMAIVNNRLNLQARSHAIDQERKRLGGELHDNLTQLISSISLLSQSLAQTYQRNPDAGNERAERIHDLAKTAFAELRKLLNELEPARDQTISSTGRSYLGLERLRSGGLAEALERLVSSMLPDGMTLKMTFASYQPQRLENEEELYRICQEAVSNVIRHAKATRLEIGGSVNEKIVLLKIRDNGCGISTKARKGLGLQTMRSRASGLGGALRITPQWPTGTLVEVALPRTDRT